MRAVITNAGSDTLYTDTGSQFFVNVTHFSVAYVNGAERNRGLDVGYLRSLTSLVPPGTNSDGEIIYNVWQTPFYNTDHAGVGGSLASSFTTYYRYEYDKELDRNILYVSRAAVIFSGLNPEFDALCNGYVSDIQLYGIAGGENTVAENTNKSSFAGITLPPFNYKVAISNGYSAHNSIDRTDDSQIMSAQDFFTSDNMEGFLVQDGAIKKYNATTPKYFPIKSWYPVKSSDINGPEIDTTESPVRAINYEISLPGYAAKNVSDITDIIKNSIGNFRFNRIGIYATKMASFGGAPGSITEFMPDQSGDNEPILFAVIELNSEVGGIAKSNGIIKNREQGGNFEYNLDWQIDLGVTSNPAFINGDRFYQESYRSQATTQLMQGIESTAVLAEGLMQLQFGMLELMHTGRNSQSVALSDMVGNGNPNPSAAPNYIPGSPTMYGPWTDTDYCDWLSIYGKMRQGAGYTSKWKKIPLVDKDFARPEIQFKEDATQYTLEDVGNILNAMASALHNFNIIKATW